MAAIVNPETSNLIVIRAATSDDPQNISIIIEFGQKGILTSIRIEILGLNCKRATSPQVPAI